MKNLSILLVGILGLLVSSCGDFTSTETPINGSLTAFTAQGEENNDTLIGVKNAEGKVIVTPAAYTGVEADENLIFCTNPDETVCIYHYDGTACGTYDSFTQITAEGNVFYIGCSGDTKSYYFLNAETINCHKSLMAKKYFFAEKDSIWGIYDYTGKHLWELPQGAIAIESIPTDELIIAVPEKGKHPICRLYTAEGNKIQTLSATKWKKLRKQLQQPTEIGTLRVYRIVPPSYVKMSITPKELSAEELQMLRYNLYQRNRLEYYA